MHARRRRPGDWSIRLRGGAYDDWRGLTPEEPGEVLVAWRCGPRCGGHATFDPHEPAIHLRTAEAYRRVELDPSEMVAVYEVGDASGGPTVEERELVGSGVLAIARRFGA